MVIIRLWGGLGNQMFQYALYQSFLHKGIPVKLDDSFFIKHHEHNGYELESVFRVSPPYTSRLEKTVMKLYGKLLHVLLGKPYRETDKMTGRFIPEVSDMKSGYLKGYWQTEKYFSGIADIVRRSFSFRPITEIRNIQHLEKMTGSESVSLHIRRGDFLEQNRDWAISKAYYQNAIRYMEERTDNPVFFVFSDDAAWAKNNISVKNGFFIDWNISRNSFRDMQMMSSCKHNIIANSSFSWWGAWLNDHADKIVIAPDRWFPGMKDTRDIIPENWIKLPVE